MQRDASSRQLSDTAREVLGLLSTSQDVGRDVLSRHHAGLPPWLLVCREVALLQSDELPTLHAIGGIKPDAQQALARRVVQLVAARLGRPLVGTGSHPLPQTLAEDWLLQWVLDPDAWSRPAGSVSQVSTRLALLRERWDPAHKRLARTPELCTLTLRLRPAADRPAAAGSFQTSPACCTTPLHDSFRDSLHLATQVVRSHLQPGAWPPAHAFEWDLQPGAGLPLRTLVDASAGAAFATAALVLLRDLALPDLAHDLAFVDLHRAVISACLADADGRLRAADRIDDKVRALEARPGPDDPDPWIYIADDPSAPRPQSGATVPCQDIRHLVARMGLQGSRGLSLGERSLLRHVLDDRPAPQDLLNTVADLGSATSLTSHLLRRYAQWGRAAESRLHARFVNLRLHNHNLPLEERVLAFTELNQVLGHTSAQGASAFQLVGEPGCGKTTLLQHHEMQSAAKALKRLHGAHEDPDPAPLELCVWLKLSGLVGAVSRDPMLSPGDWIQRQVVALGDALGEPDLLDPARRRRGGRRAIRLRLLLDGLNELLVSGQPGQLRYRINQVRDAVQSLCHSGNLLPTLLSVREGQWHDLAREEFVVHVVRVEKWSAPQQRLYVCRRLGWAGRPLLRLMSRAPGPLLEMLGLPLNLAAQCEAYEGGLRRLAQGPAELISAMVWVRLKRALRAGQLDTPELLNKAARDVLESRDHWLLNLTTLPLGGALIRELDRQGDQQWRRAGLAAPESAEDQGVVHVPADQVASHLDAPLRQAWLQAVQDLGLARLTPDEFGEGETFSFGHQLFSEFFAARGLFKPQWEPAVFGTEFRAPALEPIEDELERLADDAWLSLPAEAALEPAFKYAIEFVARDDELVARLRAVMPDNLALAASAAHRAQPRLEAFRAGQALLTDLRVALLKKCRSDEDLRLRVEAGLALGAIGDTLRYERCTGPHGPYLIARDEPGQEHWAEIESGTYRIGSQASDKQHQDNETPVTSVKLPRYRLCGLLVTNAEWRCFIDGGGNEANPQWWGHGRGQRWFEQQEFTKRARGRLPLYWNNPQHNNPLQPVTVTWWEAQAYVRWLTAQTRGHARYGLWTYRLPTEAEWDAAARGRERNLYPWGNEPPDFDRCRSIDTRLLVPNPVGAFPRGDRHVGERQALSDLSGNVQQWTSSRWTDRLDRKALTTPTTSEDGDDVLLALRGGFSWFNPGRFVRAALRQSSWPDNFVQGIGFRLAGAPIEVP